MEQHAYTLVELLSSLDEVALTLDVTTHFHSYKTRLSEWEETKSHINVFYCI